MRTEFLRVIVFSIAGFAGALAMLLSPTTHTFFKFLYRVFAVLIAGLMIVSMLGGMVSAYKFDKGDVIDVTASPYINVREPAAGTEVWEEAYGKEGVILDGTPQYKSLGGTNYWWWNIRFCDGVEGWAAEGGSDGEYLAKKSMTPSAKFKVNDRVYVAPSIGLKVRTEPPQLNYLGGQPQNAEGKIFEGPKYGSVTNDNLSSCYWFWNVDYDTGTDGWSAEGYPGGVYYLEKVLQPPDSPTHISPANGNTNVSITPTFQWNSVTGADYYGLYVSKPPYGEANLVINKIVYDTNYTLSESEKLEYNVKYYWNTLKYMIPLLSHVPDATTC